MYLPPFTVSAEAINLIAEISGQFGTGGRTAATKGKSHKDHSLFACHRGQYPKRG